MRHNKTLKQKARKTIYIEVAGNFHGRLRNELDIEILWFPLQIFQFWIICYEYQSSKKKNKNIYAYGNQKESLLTSHLLMCIWQWLENEGEIVKTKTKYNTCLVSLDNVCMSAPNSQQFNNIWWCAYEMPKKQK